MPSDDNPRVVIALIWLFALLWVAALYGALLLIGGWALVPFLGAMIVGSIWMVGR